MLYNFRLFRVVIVVTKLMRSYDKTVSMAHIASYQTTPELDAKVEEVAEQLETSKSAAMRFLLKTGYENAPLF